MVQLIWGILNILTFLGLVVFCVKKAAEIRQKIGLSVAILFSFFALSFITKPGNKEEDKKYEFENTTTKSQSLNRDTFFSEVTLDDDVSAKIKLNVICDGENVRSGLIRRSGFVGGTDWHTDFMNINKTAKKNRFQYHIGGTRKWKILGIEIYSEFKEFRGITEFKPL